MKQNTRGQKRTALGKEDITDSEGYTNIEHQMHFNKLVSLGLCPPSYLKGLVVVKLGHLQGDCVLPFCVLILSVKS